MTNLKRPQKDFDCRHTYIHMYVHIKPLITILTKEVRKFIVINLRIFEFRLINFRFFRFHFDCLFI